MKGWRLGLVVGLLITPLTAVGSEQGSEPQNGPLAGTAGPLLRVLDTDGNGTISAQEIAAAPDSLGNLDRDGDGSISYRELVAGRGRLPFARARRRGFAAGRGFGAGWRSWRGQARPRMHGGGPWASRPGLRGGRLWLRGFHDDSAWERLSGADADGDGAVSREELEAYVESRRSERGTRGRRRHDAPEQEPDTR